MQAGTAFEPSPSSRAGGAPSPGRHSCSAVRAPWVRSSWQTASWWRAVAASSGVWAPFSTHAAACGLARRSRRAATRGRDPPWAARSSAVRSVLAPTRSTEACHWNVARICAACHQSPHRHPTLPPQPPAPAHTRPPIEQRRAHRQRVCGGVRGKSCLALARFNKGCLAFASSSNTATASAVGKDCVGTGGREGSEATGMWC